MRKIVKNGILEIWLSGYIVDNDEGRLYNWLGWDAVCPNDIIDALIEANGAPVVIKVDSPGGNLVAGATIYTECMNYEGKITFEIVGLAGSAATFITQSSAKEGNTTRMSPLALFVIHNAQGGASGDYRAMEHESEKLKSANKAIISGYKLKTGKSEEEIQEMLDNEKWFSAEEALEAGLVDEIMFIGGESKPIDAGMMNMIKTQAKHILNAIPMPSTEMLEKFKANRDQRPLEDGIKNIDIENAMALLELEKARI